MNARAAPFRQICFGPVDIERQDLPDGSTVLRSQQALHEYPKRLTERLEHWAKHAPNRVFMAQRDSRDSWRELSYAQTFDHVQRIAQALLNRGLNSERPIAILCENSLEHALLGLAALHVGIPYSPISTAYSLISSDFGKLRHCLDLMTPGLVFVSDGLKYAAALEVAVSNDVEVVVLEHPPANRAATIFSDLMATPPSDAVAEAFSRITPDTPAKILFTSGSTGLPKGVINTQRMLCANLQQITQTFPFLSEDPPVLVDWLPWNHTFGGNHNVGLTLYNGGSLYIDEGKPVARGIETTINNLREIAPTVYFNVPKGFEELIPWLRQDAALREHFFSRLKMLFYAGAGLAQHVWDALEELSVQTTGERVVITTGLGMTESSPSALFAHWSGGFSGLLGVPVPGLSLKLIPNGDKLEARYHGPNITPGFWRQPGLSQTAFDDAGYFITGDALRFVDASDPNQGLLFDGRVAEDFKLTTGTWVSVGTLRSKVIETGAPWVQDAVITGHDRDQVGVIVFANWSACRMLPNLSTQTPVASVLEHPSIQQALRQLLHELRQQSTGSANRITRGMIADFTPSIDLGEITDKGSLNQRAILKHRADLVNALYESNQKGQP